MPVCLGGSEEAVHISRVDYRRGAGRSRMLRDPDIPPSEIDQKIAAHVLRYIHDGCCIQLGIGGDAQHGGGSSSLSRTSSTSAVIPKCSLTRMWIGSSQEGWTGLTKTLTALKPPIPRHRLPAKCTTSCTTNTALASYPGRLHQRSLNDRPDRQHGEHLKRCAGGPVFTGKTPKAAAPVRSPATAECGISCWLTVVQGRQVFICLASTHPTAKAKRFQESYHGFIPGTTTTIPRQMRRLYRHRVRCRKARACPYLDARGEGSSARHPDFR